MLGMVCFEHQWVITVHRHSRAYILKFYVVFLSFFFSYNLFAYCLLLSSVDLSDKLCSVHTSCFVHTNRMMQTDQGRAINLITRNVRSLNHPIERKNIMTFIKFKKCDIVFLPETHLIAQESETLCRDWVGHVFAACGSSRSAGGGY